MLLQAQIYDLIANSELIICDLTYERPNCYFEIGYAIGKGRNNALIICCRQDHNADNKDFKHDGPRVHFDLRNYSIIWWDPNNIDVFKQELSNKLQKRKRRVIAEIAEVPRDEARVRMESFGAKQRNEVGKWIKLT